MYRFDLKGSLFFLFLSVAAMTFVVTGAWAQTETSIADYETHSWRKAWGWNGDPSLDTTHVNTGSNAIKVGLVCTGATNWGNVEANELLAEATADLEIQVYAVRTSGTDDPPICKLEVDLEAAGSSSGADVTPTLDAWTPVTLPASSLGGDYKRVKIIFFENSKNGNFDFYFDTLTRGGVLWDDFEPQTPTSINIANAAAGRAEVTLGGNTLATAGPTPNEGSHALGVTWTGEADQSIEVQHNYAALDITGDEELQFDMYVQGSTLPTEIKAFLYDGSGGVFSGTDTVALNNSWETVSLDLTGITGFNPANVLELKIIINGMSDGTVFLDDMKLIDSADVEDWSVY